jgi:hypothetical protein
MRGNQRWVRENETRNFGVSMLSGGYYIYYLPAATALICSKSWEMCD